MDKSPHIPPLTRQFLTNAGLALKSVGQAVPGWFGDLLTVLGNVLEYGPPTHEAALHFWRYLRAAPARRRALPPSGLGARRRTRRPVRQPALSRAQRRARRRARRRQAHRRR